ncbi:MAG: SLC13 family permease, partial [Planctomycetota bacterium]
MLPPDFLAADLWGLSVAAWLTAAVAALMVGGLIHGKVGADLVLLSGLLALLLAGILSPSDALRGFANPGVATVGLLYVVAAGLRETGAVDRLTAPLLGRPRTSMGAVARLTAPVAVASAFVNNTPIVAMFLPVLSGWARRCHLSPRALFLPLSYAAILGGMCTLIGTSTNLVVAALIDAHRSAPSAADATPLEPLGMFTLAKVGLPIAVAGLGFIWLAHRTLLGAAEQSPDRKDSDPKEYMTALRVEPDSPVAGRTVEQAGLRHLPGLFLARIERPDETIVAVSPQQRLYAGDTLVFVGAVESVVDLQRIKGLTPAADEAAQRLQGPRHQIRLVEAVIAASSDLVGLSIRDAAFRTRYGAVVIAV